MFATPYSVRRGEIISTNFPIVLNCCTKFLIFHYFCFTLLRLLWSSFPMFLLILCKPHTCADSVNSLHLHWIACRKDTISIIMVGTNRYYPLCLLSGVLPQQYMRSLSWFTSIITRADWVSRTILLIYYCTASRICISR